MKKWHLRFHLAVTLLVCASGFAQKLDVFSVREDLAVPPAVTNGAPGAGRFVREFLPEYKGTEIYHALYLPTDWVKGKTYPVIFEYAGNTIEPSPDPNNGRVEGCRLGYGITKGSGCIWVCLPYVEPDHKTYARRWWGDREATVNYCKTVVQKICRDC